MQWSDYGPLLVGGVGLSVVKHLCLKYVTWRHKVNSKEVATIDAIYFYPFKSLKGIKVEECDVTHAALRYKGVSDRTFMIVDDNDEMIIMRQQPTLCLVTPSIRDDKLWLQAEGMADVCLPLKQMPSKNSIIRTITKHFINLKGMDCGDTIANWFNKYLNKTNLRVIYFYEQEVLIQKEMIGFQSFLEQYSKPWDMTTFSEASPLTLMSQESVDDLNTRLDEEDKIMLGNFRMNLIVKGCDPYAEDFWDVFYIGDQTKIHMWSANPRCIACNINTTTGIRNKNFQPLKGLLKYRPGTEFRATLSKDLQKFFANNPMMGIFCGVDVGGTIKVGDIVRA
ncbi:unnamed protein product [Owenia fusiformis]|uniref:MOSC domain-containing protein n=1 Tax=Owenia fusiformis TaxID=6347 RepID=A0A8S4PIC1_OWEFU|nr:unnamed protein product [Owenia fusiformis]